MGRLGSCRNSSLTLRETSTQKSSSLGWRYTIYKLTSDSVNHLYTVHAYTILEYAFIRFFWLCSMMLSCWNFKSKTPRTSVDSLPPPQSTMTFSEGYVLFFPKSTCHNCVVMRFVIFHCRILKFSFAIIFCRNYNMQRLSQTVRLQHSKDKSLTWKDSWPLSVKGGGYELVESIRSTLFSLSSQL